MNLTFGVCWIENQASEQMKASVEDAIRQNGFEPDVELVVSQDDIRSFARRQHHFQEYDLILLDLGLGDDLQGDDLAPTVRQHFRSTPIVFYSAVSERELRRKMASKGVDGVYCTSRNSLATRVGQLVSDLTPALNRLSGMRGLAAQVVAECDEEFRQILIHLSNVQDNEPEVVQSLKDALSSAHGRQTAGTQEIDDLRELLATPAISSGLLFGEVRKRFRATPPDSDRVREAVFAIREYDAEVLNRRNVLSHALEKRTAHGWVIERGPQRPNLTAEDFRDFRAVFLTRREEIRRLRQLLINQ